MYPLFVSGGDNVIHERLKTLRKELGLTQQEFAERINLRRNSIAQIELGYRNPSGAVLALICREFNVNETWLRTGEGEMFAKAPTDIVSEVAEKLGLNDFEQLILNAYVKLPKQLRDAFCVGMREGVFHRKNRSGGCRSGKQVGYQAGCCQGRREQRSQSSVEGRRRCRVTAQVHGRYVMQIVGAPASLPG